MPTTKSSTETSQELADQIAKEVFGEFSERKLDPEFAKEIIELIQRIPSAHPFLRGQLGAAMEYSKLPEGKFKEDSMLSLIMTAIYFGYKIGYRQGVAEWFGRGEE